VLQCYNCQGTPAVVLTRGISRPHALNKGGAGVVVTDLLDQQDKLSLEGFLLVVEFEFCRGRGCNIDQLTER
jgi:hypothetical protein